MSLSYSDQNSQHQEYSKLNHKKTNLATFQKRTNENSNSQDEICDLISCASDDNTLMYDIPEREFTCTQSFPDDQDPWNVDLDYLHWDIESSF